MESHLLQMRGLKLDRKGYRTRRQGRIFYRCVDWNVGAERISRYLNVASFTDAWIETLSLIWYISPRRRIFYRCVDWNSPVLKYQYLPKVASFTDAWIETGIKMLENIARGVASFTDAWIETGTPYDGRYVLKSHLLQMRGLKQIRHGGYRIAYCRIFYRCVDWNAGRMRSVRTFNVASFTDAWIETIKVKETGTAEQSHLLQMRGLKQCKDSWWLLYGSRIFYRCVDWNRNVNAVLRLVLGRIFYRCVDWNPEKMVY